MLPASQDDDFRAGQRHAGADEQLVDAGGRARLEERILAEEKFPDVDRVEAVDVLAEIDRAEDFLLLEVARQRRLDEDAVDFRIVVEPVDQVEQFLLGGFLFQHDRVGADADLLAFWPFIRT